nr:hypothetical protein [Tanacetum cinerariifolium]
MQTQTSNTLYNAIIEAGSKDHPPMLAPEWQRFVTLVKQSQELKTVSYHKLYDILKQHQNEVNEIRAERIARNANPLALVAQQQPEFGYVARECQKPKRAKDKTYHREKMLLCKQEEAGIQLNAEQADWKDDTDDESDDQELEAHYMYMAKLQEVIPDAADNSRPIFDTKPVQQVQPNDNYNVFAIESEHHEQSQSIHDTYPIEQDEHNVIIDSLDMSYDKDQINQNDGTDDLDNEHQETISILTQQKETQIKLYKSREDKELDKVIALENKVKIHLDSFLRSKDETPEVLIDFLRLVQRGLQAQVRIVRTDKGTKFLNQTLHADGENLNKMKEKGDACVFVGYSTQSRAYMVFNKRTRVIVETIHVNFDELPQMASDHVSSDLASECQRTALEHESLSPGLQCQENVSQAAETIRTSNELDLLFSLMFDELLNGSAHVVSKSSAITTADTHNQRQHKHTPPLNNHSTTDPTCQVPTQAPTVTSTENMNQAEMIAENAQIAGDEFINIFCTPVQDRWETSSRHVDSSNMLTFYQRQLESDGEMCMFALIVSQTKPKNIKEAMADSA